MASTYRDPSDYLAWYIEGDDIAIVTSRTLGNDNTTILATSDKGLYKTVDETVTDGIMISYNAEPDKVTAVGDYPDIDNSMHSAIVDYVKYRLYLDSGRQEMLSIALTHKRNWEEATKRFGMKKRDKTGGTRQLLTYSLR